MQDFRQITVVRLHNLGEPRHMIFWPTGEFNVIRPCLRTFPLEENIPRVAAAPRGCGPALSSRAEAVRASAFLLLLLPTSTTPVGEGLSRPTLSCLQQHAVSPPAANLFQKLQQQKS